MATKTEISPHNSVHHTVSLKVAEYLNELRLKRVAKEEKNQKSILQSFFTAREDFDNAIVSRGVVEWRSLLEGDELRQKIEMWFGVCVKLREHIEKKRLRHS